MQCRSCMDYLFVFFLTFLNRTALGTVCFHNFPSCCVSQKKKVERTMTQLSFLGELILSECRWTAAHFIVSWSSDICEGDVSGNSGSSRKWTPVRQRCDSVLFNQHLSSPCRRYAALLCHSLVLMNRRPRERPVNPNPGGVEIMEG